MPAINYHSEAHEKSNEERIRAMRLARKQLEAAGAKHSFRAALNYRPPDVGEFSEMKVGDLVLMYRRAGKGSNANG